ncbi:transposase [Achromobacter pestifer]
MAPRLPRVIVARCPHHVVQRRHSRQRIFIGDDDRQAYLNDLYEKKHELGVEVHAYCLMSNHVHLLLTPGDDVAAVGRLMKEIARRATRRWNERSGGSGSLWESRFKSSVVQSDAYLLACCRYIERNPVRASMVEKPEDYQWSSYRARMGLSIDSILDLHAVYLALGSSAARRVAYLQYMASAIPEADLDVIRMGSRSSHPTATPEFVMELEAALQRKVVPRRRGRPSKM